MPILNKSGLCAILSFGLAGCVIDNSKNDSPPYFRSLSLEDTIAGKKEIKQDNVSLNAGQYNDFNPIAEIEKSPDVFVDFGLISINAKQNSFSLELLNKPLSVNLYKYDNLESYRNDYPIYSGLNHEDYLFNRLDNEGCGEPIPISVLGKAVKELIWPTDIAKPIRKLSDKVSSFSDVPTRFIFGEQAKSDLSFKLDSDKFGFFYKAHLNYRWDLRIDYQHDFDNSKSLGDKNDGMIFVSLSANFGPEKYR